jgi:hypothetical protein
MMLEDEGVPHQIVGSIVEILDCKRCRVNRSKPRVRAADDMLLYQVHTYPRKKG